MRKNIYEVFDEFEKESTNEGRVNVLARNWTPTLKLVLQLAYRPEVQWKHNKFPASYKREDVVPGYSFASLDTEIKRLYIFQKGNPSAEKLTTKRSEELLVVLLESLEPREADIIMGIFRKNLNVKGLTEKFIRKNIPDIF
jgi:hypothetical protein